jgi:exodeoxyribonuclease VIII
MSARIITEPSDQYFLQTKWVSRSMLKLFRERRRLFEQRYVLRSLPDEPPNDAMVKGTAAHAVLLEGKSIEDCCTIIPAEALNADGHKKGAAWKAFESANAGKHLLKAEQVEETLAAIRAVQSHPSLGKLMTAPSKREHSVYWIDRDTDIQLRCRPDWIVERPDSVAVLDFKITADATPQGFRKQIENGLWLQAAMYLAGVESVINADSYTFIFVAVDSKAPYSCVLHELDQDSLSSAFAAYRRTLRQFSECLESGDWSDPCEHVINSHRLRESAFADNFSEGVY